MEEKILFLLHYLSFLFLSGAPYPCDGECHSEDVMSIFITNLTFEVLSTIVLPLGSFHTKLLAALVGIAKNGYSTHFFGITNAI